MRFFSVLFSFSPCLSIRCPPTKYKVCCHTFPYFIHLKQSCVNASKSWAMNFDSLFLHCEIRNICMKIPRPNNFNSWKKCWRGQKNDDSIRRWIDTALDIKPGWSPVWMELAGLLQNGSHILLSPQSPPSRLVAIPVLMSERNRNGQTAMKIEQNVRSILW